MLIAEGFLFLQQSHQNKNVIRILREEGKIQDLSSFLSMK